MLKFIYATYVDSSKWQPVHVQRNFIGGSVEAVRSLVESEVPVESRMRHGIDTLMVNVGNTVELPNSKE